MLFEEVVYEYIEAKETGIGAKKIRPNTMEGYMSAIKCHLMPMWAGREIESITCDELQEWVDGFELTGAAKKAFITFRQIYRWHLKKHRVRIWDETQGVELPQHVRRQAKALTATELNEATHDVIGEDFDAGVIVQGAVGCRPCEVSWLRWRNINLSTGAVELHGGRHEVAGVVYESETKTPKGRRVVILPRYAVIALRAVKKARGAGPDDLVVPLSPATYRRRVRSWFHRRGLAMCAQHLRHTFGTLAIEMGMDPLVIAAMLGHASLDTLYEHYFASSANVFRKQISAYNEAVLSAAPERRLQAA